MSKTTKAKGKAKSKTPAKTTYRPRRTPEEFARLTKSAERLLSAKDRRMTVAQVAAHLKVPAHWVYYNVGSAAKLRVAAA